MSFAIEINELLKSDASLNAIVDGGIHYENLVDNFLGNTDVNMWIVYEFNRTPNDCLGQKDVFSTYQLSVVVIGRNINDDIDEVSQQVVNLINDYTGGGIADITFTGDQSGFNQQQKTYTNTLAFSCFYVKS